MLWIPLSVSWVLLLQLSFYTRMIPETHAFVPHAPSFVSRHIGLLDDMLEEEEAKRKQALNAATVESSSNGANETTTASSNNSTDSDTMVEDKEEQESHLNQKKFEAAIEQDLRELQDMQEVDGEEMKHNMNVPQEVPTAAGFVNTYFANLTRNHPFRNPRPPTTPPPAAEVVEEDVATSSFTNAEIQADDDIEVTHKDDTTELLLMDTEAQKDNDAASTTDSPLLVAEEEEEETKDAVLAAFFENTDKALLTAKEEELDAVHLIDADAQEDNEPESTNWQEDTDSPLLVAEGEEEDALLAAFLENMDQAEQELDDIHRDATALLENVGDTLLEAEEEEQEEQDDAIAYPDTALLDTKDAEEDENADDDAVTLTFAEARANLYSKKERSTEATKVDDVDIDDLIEQYKGFLPIDESIAVDIEDEDEEVEGVAQQLLSDEGDMTLASEEVTAIMPTEEITEARKPDLDLENLIEQYKGFLESDESIAADEDYYEGEGEGEGDNQPLSGTGEGFLSDDYEHLDSAVDEDGSEREDGFDDSFLSFEGGLDYDPINEGQLPSDELPSHDHEVSSSTIEEKDKARFIVNPGGLLVDSNSDNVEGGTKEGKDEDEPSFDSNTLEDEKDSRADKKENPIVSLIDGVGAEEEEKFPSATTIAIAAAREKQKFPSASAIAAAAASERKEIMTSYGRFFQDAFPVEQASSSLEEEKGDMDYEIVPTMKELVQNYAKENPIDKEALAALHADQLADTIENLPTMEDLVQHYAKKFPLGDEVLAALRTDHHDDDHDAVENVPTLEELVRNYANEFPISEDVLMALGTDQHADVSSSATDASLRDDGKKQEVKSARKNTPLTAPKFGVKMPKIEMPKVEIPKWQMPKIQMPKMEIPKLRMPKMDMPKMDMPKMEMPKVEMPTMDDEQVELAVATARKGLESFTKGLAFIAKETVDIATEARNHMNTTTVGDDTITYEEALEKVSKSAKGLTKLFGGLIRDSVSFVATEIKNKNEEALAVKRAQKALRKRTVPPAGHSEYVQTEPSVDETSYANSPFQLDSPTLSTKEKSPMPDTLQNTLDEQLEGETDMAARKEKSLVPKALQTSLDGNREEVKEKTTSLLHFVSKKASHPMKDLASKARQQPAEREQRKSKAEPAINNLIKQVKAATLKTKSDVKSKANNNPFVSEAQKKVGDMDVDMRDIKAKADAMFGEFWSNSANFMSDATSSPPGTAGKNGTSSTESYMGRLATTSPTDSASKKKSTGPVPFYARKKDKENKN